MSAHVPRPLQNPGTRLKFVAAVLGLSMALVAGMAWLVLSELEELSTANSDNLQWTLAQADVEYLRFRLAIDEARHHDGSLADVRRRFDIFYSRMDTLERGTVYQTLRESREFDAPRERLTTFLSRTIPLIDAPDAQLEAGLGDLAAQALAISPHVRALSLSGLSAFAQLSDHRRAELTKTLVSMAFVLALLVAGLVLLALSLFRMARLAQARAHQIDQTAARLTTIIETSQDAIIVTNRQGEILDFSPSAERLFGYAHGEALGQKALDLLVPPEQAEAIRPNMAALLANEHKEGPCERKGEIVAVDKSGRVFPAEFSIDLADDGETHLFVAFLRDISQRKVAEAGLKDARDRALAGERAKAEFLAVMSHEMRTPLNGLLGTMDLLHDHSLTERQTALVERMQSSGRLLLGLVNDVLDLSKFEAGKMEAEARPFSFAKLLDGVVATAAPLAVANGNSLSWRWVGPAKEGAVGDSRRLRQVLLNLVGNAIKFTRGGKVEIEVECIKAPTPIAEFRVIDTGIGIAPEDLDRIFQDFVTLDTSYARKAGGTGLGLGIARRLANLMGGAIGAQSTASQGTTFWLRVPLVPLSEALLPSDAPERPRSPRESLNLLIVEDNEINRFVLREMLEGAGHNVTEAINGRAGVEWANAERFDAILMDISMPVMDGVEATRIIRAGSGPSRNAPIIAVTAHALHDEILRFREAGMELCISKPIDRTVLMQTLDRIGPNVTGPTAKAAPSTDDLVDLAQVHILATALHAAKRRGYLDRFAAETGQAVTILSAATEGTPEIAAIAHKCAGSCAAFGLTALRQSLAEIETRIKQGQPLDPGLMATLEATWTQSLQALEGAFGAEITSAVD
ncbi:hybrid sensor histidine kinase/response regulator [Seohaeicola zhoushanensis]|uniref:histidine kinase n=1 Tax=Seohaeicola zhoushanensis TaxID=1569283 RepID=A0A8J3GYR1_9RHOB|nr:PAS domain-containing hybrid sensor histidine kinase/response regulator [Seohaeicola zhoushanensis]GHF59119.1 hybrid sensor histidine kinase/response regulator [Seohaeicola zhoushanensis]